MFFNVDGRFLEAPDMDSLRDEALEAEAEGAGIVFLDEKGLGDPVVLAAGLSTVVPRVLLGVRVSVAPGARHPAILARELTCLDLVSGGRAVLWMTTPHAEQLVEAMALCRTLWREGVATSDGPSFPVHGAVNRPRPSGSSSPLLALELTEGPDVADGGSAMVEQREFSDLLVIAGETAGRWRVEATAGYRRGSTS